MLPLLAAPWPAAPADVAAGPADAFEIKMPDGLTMQLSIDATTHLPAQLVWMDKPIVTFSSAGTMSVSQRTGQVTRSPMPMPPPGDVQDQSEDRSENLQNRSLKPQPQRLLQ